MLTLNIQSLHAKFDSFKIWIEELATKDIFISAICLQETWITDTDKSITDLYSLPGYNIISLPASISSHSGLFIHIKDNLKFALRDFYTPSKIWEGLIIDIFNNLYIIDYLSLLSCKQGTHTSFSALACPKKKKKCPTQEHYQRITLSLLSHQDGGL